MPVGFYRFVMISFDFLDYRCPGGAGGLESWISAVLAQGGGKCRGHPFGSWQVFWAFVKRLSGVSFLNLSGLLRMPFGLDCCCPAAFRMYGFVEVEQHFVNWRPPDCFLQSDPLTVADKSTNVSPK